MPVTPLRRRDRGPDPAAIVAFLLVTFVALGLLKPWQPSRGGTAEAPPVAPARPAEAAPSAVGGGGDALRVASEDLGLGPPRSLGAFRLGLPTLRWDDVRALEPEPDEWGVHALIARPDRRPADRPPAADEVLVDSSWFVASRWAPATPLSPGLLSYSADPGRIVSDAVIVPTGEEAVAALGVTSPLDEIPLDIRIWRLRRGAVPERLILREMPGREPGGRRLFLAPPAKAVARDHWAPGLYRVDMLLGDRISRLTVLLPGRPQTGPEREEPEIIDIAELSRRFGDLPPGPFVVDIAHGPVHLTAAPSPPLDERQAWLSEGRPGSERSNVLARVEDSGILAMGYSLGPDRRFASALLYRLAPDGGRVPAAPMVGRPTRWPEPPANTRIAWAVFQPEGGGLSWVPGIYRMDVEWLDAAGRHRASWHIDLVPLGAPALEPPFLAAVRDWAGYAGRPGVVVGTARQDEGGPRSARMRAFPQPPGRADPEPERLGQECGGGALIDAGQHLVGIGYQAVGAVSVAVRRRFVDGQVLEVPVASVTSAVPGLAVLGLAEGGPWRPGVYEVDLARGALFPPNGGAPSLREQRFVVCVGRAGAAGLRVPDSAVSAEAYAAASRGLSNLGAIWPLFGPGETRTLQPR